MVLGGGEGVSGAGKVRGGGESGSGVSGRAGRGRGGEWCWEGERRGESGRGE